MKVAVFSLFSAFQLLESHLEESKPDFFFLHLLISCFFILESFHRSIKLFSLLSGISEFNKFQDVQVEVGTDDYFRIFLDD